MSDHIYAIMEHPETFEMVFIEYEIVYSTPQYYDIEPRNIPNRRAMLNTRRIKKRSVCPGHCPAMFYWSKTQAIEMERKRQEHRIEQAESAIRDARQEIEAINALYESLPHYEK